MTAQHHRAWLFAFLIAKTTPSLSHLGYAAGSHRGLGERLKDLVQRAAKAALHCLLGVAETVLGGSVLKSPKGRAEGWGEEIGAS